MNWQGIWRAAKSDYLKLAAIMALGFYLTFFPHLNYPYPVHIDDWVNLAFFKAMLRAGNITFVDPFSGAGKLGLSANLEPGYLLFWGVFHQISGISWLTIFRYFPSVIFVITILAVYILAHRQGFGWEAALFASLIPTTVGILGPAFLVALAMALIFIALGLFVAFYLKHWWSYVVLFIFTIFLLSIHAPSAIGLVMVLTPYILLNFRSNPKHSLAIALALALPFVGAAPWIFDLVLSTARSLLNPVPPRTTIEIPRIILTYGYLPILLCLLGTFTLVLKGDKTSLGLVLGLLTLLLMLVTYFTFHYGVSLMYQRGLMYMMLMVSVVAGAGLGAVRKLRLPIGWSEGLRLPVITQNMGNILCLVLVSLTLAWAIPERQDLPYYHMIDGTDYEAFAWIRDNLNDSHKKAILDPWKATAFTAITEKHIYTRIHERPHPSDTEASNFLSEGCTNTAFMKANGISIVYSREGCQNPELVEVRKHVYLLKEAEAK